MYVLDTNAFYYASEISDFTYDIRKLQKLIENNEVFISSTSLFEFLIKYRNDIDTIHKGGKYLYDQNIMIAGNPVNPLPDYFNGELWNISEADLNRLCTDILANKIEIESDFITVLFDICLISGLFFSALSDGNEPSDYCYHVLCGIYRFFSRFNKSLIKDAFAEGYKTDDCENYIRNEFYKLLAFELEKGLPFVERSKIIQDDENIPDADDWISSIDYSDDTEKLYNKLQKSTSTAFLSRLAVNYWKKNNDPELIQLISRIKTIIDRKIPHTALQDYYFDTLKVILTQGAAVWKNDLLDAIILCNLENEHVLITYDNGVINRLDRRKDEYPKYLESLKCINNLRGKDV